jgi:hypothetical protein
MGGRGWGTGVRRREGRKTAARPAAGSRRGTPALWIQRCRHHEGRELARGGGRVVIPRALELERGRLRQRLGGRWPSTMRHGPRAGGRMVVVHGNWSLSGGACVSDSGGRCRPRGSLDLERVGGWGSSHGGWSLSGGACISGWGDGAVHVEDSTLSGWADGSRPRTREPGYLIAVALCLISFSSPRLWELWESRAGGWWTGFPTDVGRSGGGGWRSRAFHIRSASIAWVGGRLLHLPGFVKSAEPRPELRADLREPRAALRAALAEPRADLRAALRGQILRPPPPSLPFGSALSRLENTVGRNETSPGYNLSSESP